ncbi:myo-inositol oxygenase 5 [Perilla frutescens var. frutescens]|nr:myo-inositol oxygenase 5 [Perilla frutescens var. frutescens]
MLELIFDILIRIFNFDFTKGVKRNKTGEVRGLLEFVGANKDFTIMENRDYDAQSERQREVVKTMRAEYGKSDKVEMCIRKSYELLTSLMRVIHIWLSLIQHLLQTTEAIKKDYLNENWKQIISAIWWPLHHQIRYHSFYALHRVAANNRLMNEKDKKNRKWLQIFNKHDLYIKRKIRIDVEKLKSYYLSLTSIS